MLTHYLSVLVFLILAIGFGLVPLIAGRVIGPHKPDPEKLSAYECGFEAFGHARMPFDVRYYLIAILFIIFDVETAFFFPWAVALRQIGWFGFLSVLMFLGILLAGFIFEWKRGALTWE